MKKTVNIDRFQLKRDKEMTPGARIDWLAAALQFTRMQKTKEKKKKIIKKGGTPAR